MTASIHDAKPQDVYVDKSGKLWRVVGTWSMPTVVVEEIEPPDPGETPVRRHGGVNGAMWDGFKRIHRVLQDSDNG
jgi:hypothetical protein